MSPMHLLGTRRTLLLTALTSAALLPGTIATPAPSIPLTLRLVSRAPNPPSALPPNAPAADVRWQPSLDFDTDGCYNVPAIDGAGNVAQGLPHEFVGLSSDCHDPSDLDNNNVYSRSRCNNGWCVYLYDYYFEKDVALQNFIDTGHTHDWEHIAVWVSDATGNAEFVAASQHGNYEIKKAADVRWDGSHPKMVYHKDGLSTHCFRFANAADDAIENARGVWFRGDVVGYDGFPAGVRDILYAHDFGSAVVALKDGQFEGNLDKARPKEITAFNSAIDG